MSKKRLLIPHLPNLRNGSSLEDMVAALASLQAVELTEVAWADYPYKPLVEVKIAYTMDSILLEFAVKEKHVKAEYRNTNDPVYKDSCVEFFLSFDGSKYYNLEFNCLGTGLIGYGDAVKDKRRPLPKSTVEKVRTYSTIHAKSREDGDTAWHLLLDIPFVIFYDHAIDTLVGTTCTGNFYKCGDELPDPHFVSWNRVDHPFPNFHLPQFFGELQFL